MNVNVNLTAGQLQKKEHYREHRGRNDIPVGFSERVLDDAVANQASVDKHVNGIAIELLDFGFGNEAVSAQLAKRFFFLLGQIFADGACTKRKSAGVTLLLFPPPRWGLRQADSFKRLQGGDGNQLIQNLFSEDLVNALAAIGHRRRNQNCIGGRVQLEMLIGMRQGVMGDERSDVGKFGRFGFEKFLPRRRIKEKIAHRNRSAFGQASFFDAQNLAAVNLKHGSRGFSWSASLESQTQNGSDRRQCFASESKDCHDEHVFGALYF